jgi:hypothetical protein
MLLDTAEKAEPAAATAAPRLAVAAVLMVNSGVPLPAANRVVQALAKLWPLVDKTDHRVEVMVLDGTLVMEPVWIADTKTVGHHAFSLSTIETVDPASVKRASVYMVFDIRYIVAVVEATTKATKDA